VTTIFEIEKALLKDLEKVTKTILIQKGVKNNSDLYKNLEWVNKDDKFITLIALDYFEYLDTGRRKGIMPPVEDLIPWIKKNNITPRQGQTINQLAFTIANAIKRDGIKGKKYTDAIIESTTDIISDELSDMIAENICDATVEAIENKNF
jgi:hypothetical protein